MLPLIWIISHFPQSWKFLIFTPSRAVLLVIGIGACVALLFGGVSSCSMMAGSGVGGVFTSSYLSDDTDMLAAEAAYCELEQELQYELDHYEALHPGYDEYRFDLDEIEHDPYVLISILTAFHEGVFTIDEVQAELQMLFEKQYILTQTVEVEVRYRTETRTDSEGNDYDVEVPYNYYICKVKLENFDLSHVPVYIMDEETLSLYAVYMATLGNREDLFPGSGYVDKYTKPPTTYDIIMLTALDGEESQIKGLDLQADDYITKPFSMPVLIRKIAAILRRTSKQEDTPHIMSYKDLTLDLDGYKVYSSEGNIELTPREFEILRELLNHKGRILTRQNFLQTLWKYEFFGDERIIDTHIKNLRKKLGTVDYIETIRGVGYRIDKEDKE